MIKRSISILSLCLGIIVASIIAAHPMLAISVFATPSVRTSGGLQSIGQVDAPWGVLRMAVATAGDAVPIEFVYSSSGCTLGASVTIGGFNNKSGDIGSQVPANDGGCWEVVYPPSGADPREFGAVGNQSTDDSTAILNAIAAAGTSGNKVSFSGGNYCVERPIHVTSPYLIIDGGGSTEVQTCGVDTSIFSLEARHIQLLNLSVQGCCFGTGSAGLTTVNPTIIETSGCVECDLRMLTVIGGSYALEINSADDTAENIVVTDAYGPGLLHVDGISTSYASIYMRRAKLDQLWPSTAPSYGTSIAAWSACATVTPGTVLSLNGWYIQVVTGTKTGNSAPTLMNYNQNIVDNSAGCAGGGSNAVEMLTAPQSVNYSSVVLGSYVTNYYEVNSDHTGPFYSAWYSNAGGGAFGPQSSVINNAACGEVLEACGLFSDGGNLIVSGTQVSNCVLTNCSGFVFQSRWQGDATINGLTAFNVGSGVFDSVGSVSGGVFSQAGLTVQGSVFGNNHVSALAANPGVVGFNFSNNQLASSIWGDNTAGIVTQGASDYYNITNNLCGGAPACISDGASGTHKTVTGNN